MKQFLEFIPLLAFFFGLKTGGAITAAAAMLGATVVVHIILFVIQSYQLTKQQWLVLLLTVVMCSVTVILNDDFFIKAKSPIINAVFAVVLLGSVLINKPLIKMALGQAFVLSNNGWKKLTLAWACFFALMGSLHYVTAFHMSEEVWGNFKLWGWIPFMLIFMVAQFAILRNHVNPELSQKKDK